MKKKKLLTFVLFLFFIHAAQSENDIRVMTFNIRYDNPADGQNAWSHRKENVGTMLKYYEPDILGAQEVLHNQLKDIKKMLPLYGHVGVGRTDGKKGGEYCSLLFKKDRFDLLDSGNFSLSEQPNKIGIKAWDAACERIVTWAILKDKKSGKEITVFNTHFDHIGAIARKESSKLLLSFIETLAGNRPVIVTGDFNGTSDSEAIRILTEKKYLKDARSLSPIVYGPIYSFHDFGRMEESEKSLIDFIFVRGDVKVKKYRVIEDSSCGFLSDHNPIEIYVEVE